MTVLAKSGFKPIAVDLPGFGNSQKNNFAHSSPAEWLLDVFTALGISEENRPIIVSPSMSGRFSVPFVLKHSRLLGGFVPIAPVSAEEHANELAHINTPTLIVWGSNDMFFPVAIASKLDKAMPCSETLILKDATHACYIDQPTIFNAALIEFAKKVRDQDFSC